MGGESGVKEMRERNEKGGGESKVALKEGHRRL